MSDPTFPLRSIRADWRMREGESMADDQARQGSDETSGGRHLSSAEQREVTFHFFLGLRKRDRDERQARRQAEARRESKRATWLPVAGFAIIAASALFTTLFARAISPNPVTVFMVLAVAAAGLALVAAYITLGAHEGSPSLDLLGKQLGFAAALFAFAATLFLSGLDFKALNPSGESTPSPTSTCTPIGRFATDC